jgi:hypothetical protein
MPKQQNPPTTGREIVMAKYTYEGLAPDTDPMYHSAGKIMLEQNLSPSFVEKLKARSDAAANPVTVAPRRPAKVRPRRKK